MSEEQKESLKEKLKNFFDEKLNSLTTKFETDINTLEAMMYEYFDNVVIPFREIEEKEKNEKEKEKEKEKDKKEESKEEKTKNAEEGKTLKKIKPLTLKETNLTKTPLKANKKRDLGFKEKTEIIPKKSNKIFSDKKKEKDKKEDLNKTLPNERTKKKNLTSIDVTKKEAKVRPSKTPINKRGRKTDEDKEPAPKTKTMRATAAKTATSKKFTAQGKGKGKPADKKGKKEKDKKKVEKEKEEDKKEEIIEEKKEIVLKDKRINKVPEELKDNNALFNIYLILKGNYLTNKEKYKLLLHNPTIYKCFGNNIQFLLDDKKKEIKDKITELETFLNKYGDLESYLSKEFSPSKSAQNSLMFVKRDEIEKIIKNGDIPPEIVKIFKLLFYIFDIPFDESLENENLLNYFLEEVMDKNNVKELKSIASNYLSNHKDLNITKEKFEKINSIISSDEKVVSSVDIAKICRNISYCTLLIKEVNEFINLRTLDDVPYYELRLKNKDLQEYKKQLATLNNNGIPPSIEETKEAPNESENNEVTEIKVESTNAEESSVPKEGEE